MRPVSGLEVLLEIAFIKSNQWMGKWLDEKILAVDVEGKIDLPNFPCDLAQSETDWGLKFVSASTQ